jgi:hypothetical protein
MKGFRRVLKMSFLLLMLNSTAMSGEALNHKAKTSAAWDANVMETRVETRQQLCDELTTAGSADTLSTSCYEKHLYLKTNLIGWGMLLCNLGVEMTSGSHWSTSLHGYYSSWNYFHSNVKFRTMALQTELRYWLADATHNGCFVAGHFGLAWWNYALGGEYRRQDHKGHTPAYGGGLNFGYRKAIGERWHVEFSAGAGVYQIIYDKFINSFNGAKVENAIHRTWIGLDNLSVSFVYNFDINY